MMTAFNVGLNEVSLRTGGNRNVQYSVRYLRWAAYVIGLGAALGIVLVLAFLFRGVDDQIGRYTFVADPVSNRQIGLGLFWGLVLFWALGWPWLLIVIHRPFARRLLDRIIRGVDGTGASRTVRQ